MNVSGGLRGIREYMLISQNVCSGLFRRGRIGITEERLWLVFEYWTMSPEENIRRECYWVDECMLEYIYNLSTPNWTGIGRWIGRIKGEFIQRGEEITVCVVI